MDWIQFSIFVITMGGIFLTLRSDTSLNRQESATDRRDILKLMNEIKDDHRKFREMWAEESKDFHGRLCAIEERNKGK